MIGKFFKHPREENGVEILEFAFILPLLAILLMGGIEFGRAFYTYNILTKSVRNAARYLSAEPIGSTGNINSSTVTRAQNVAVCGKTSACSDPASVVVPGLVDDDIQIQNPATTVGGRIYVKVSATYAYPSLFRFMISGASFQPSVTMEAVGPVTF
jgi:Flp pilus assembly protein TadG